MSDAFSRTRHRHPPSGFGRMSCRANANASSIPVGEPIEAPHIASRIDAPKLDHASLEIVLRLTR
jgi:hypothetical protein